MTIREALTQAYKKTSPLDASILLVHALNTLAQRRKDTKGKLKLTKTNLLTMGNDPIGEEEVVFFSSLIERRINGECTAYIVGKKEFWGLEFFVSPAVLVPRPETELLVEKCLEFVKELRSCSLERTAKIRILDLCTGSGVIAVALKHEMPELEVFAADISPQALETAKKNAARLLPNNKKVVRKLQFQNNFLRKKTKFVDFCRKSANYERLVRQPTGLSNKSNNITFLQSDLYSAVPCSFHLILSNPPYIPTNEISSLSAEVLYEPHLALDGGSEGLEIIRRIIKQTPQFLVKNGALLMEADPRQMRKIKIMLKDNGFRNVIIYKDLAGLERVIGGVFFNN